MFVAKPAQQIHGSLVLQNLVMKVHYIIIIMTFKPYTVCSCKCINIFYTQIIKYVFWYIYGFSLPRVYINACLNDLFFLPIMVQNTYIFVFSPIIPLYYNIQNIQMQLYCNYSRLSFNYEHFFQM